MACPCPDTTYAAMRPTHRPARTTAPAAAASRWWRRAAGLAVLLGSLIGCASLPQHVERTAS